MLDIPVSPSLVTTNMSAYEASTSLVPTSATFWSLFGDGLDCLNWNGGLAIAPSKLVWDRDADYSPQDDRRSMSANGESSWTFSTCGDTSEDAKMALP